MKLLLEYLGLEGKPPYNIDRDQKNTDPEPYHRITLIKDKEHFEQFKKSTQWSGAADIVDVHERWTSKKKEYEFGFGHFHKIDAFEKLQEDTISHYTIEDILWRSSYYVDGTTEKETPWLYRFVCYNFTDQLLGTTLTSKLLDRNNKYSGEITNKTSVKPANQMRKKAYELVTQNKQVSSNRLIRLKFDEFTEDDSAISFAGVEYLVYEHKNKLVKLLTDGYKKEKFDNPGKYDLLKLIGMTPEEFDKGRDEFIKRNYVGLRNNKN